MKVFLAFIVGIIGTLLYVGSNFAFMLKPTYNGQCVVSVEASNVMVMLPFGWQLPLPSIRKE